MTTTTTTIEKIREQLLDMAEGNARWKLADVWNTYCEEYKYPDDVIYSNDLDEMENYFDSIGDFYRALGEYNVYDYFFSFDGYGVLNSYDLLTSPYSPVDFDSLAEWLLDNSQYWDELGIDDGIEEED